MKVLVLRNCKLEVQEIDNTLEELQKIVGGYIEIPYLSNRFNDNGIDVIINEEGKFIDGLNPEIAIIDRATEQILDVVYGSCVFVSHDAEGDTTELNDEQMKIVMEELQMEATLTYNETGKEAVVKVLFAN